MPARQMVHGKGIPVDICRYISEYFAANFDVQDLKMRFCCHEYRNPGWIRTIQVGFNVMIDHTHLDLLRSILEKMYRRGWDIALRFYLSVWHFLPPKLDLYPFTHITTERA